VHALTAGPSGHPPSPSAAVPAHVSSVLVVVIMLLMRAMVTKKKEEKKYTPPVSYENSFF